MTDDDSLSTVPPILLRVPRRPSRPTTRVRGAVVGVIAALALVATSCGGSADTSVETSAVTGGDTPAVTSAVVPAEVSPTEVVPAEASIVASTVAGGQIDFASLEGQDVVLWFWAPW